MTQNPHEDPEYMALYEIPIEQLELSEAANLALKRTGVITVGDCVDYFLPSGAMIDVSFSFREAMHTEVEASLKKHGYWSFYEKYADR